MKFIITRPKEDSAAIAAALHERGHEVVLAPLIKIAPRLNIEVPALGFQAVCFTSANAVRHLPAGVSRQLSAFTVGAQSAAAASIAGFKHIEAKGGDVEGLASHITQCLNPSNGAILYISGSETSGDLAGALRGAGFIVTKLVAYDAVPLQLTLSAVEVAACDGVLLYSKRSAKLWMKEMQRLELFPRLSHICLSQQIREALPEKWRRKVALEATEASLLELIDLVAK